MNTINQIQASANTIKNEINPAPCLLNPSSAEAAETSTSNNARKQILSRLGGIQPSAVGAGLGAVNTPPTPDQIKADLTQIATTDAYNGTVDLYNQFMDWLSGKTTDPSNPLPPVPSAGDPYSKWNVYAKACQAEFSALRSKCQNAASQQLTNDITAYGQKNNVDAWGVANSMKPSLYDDLGSVFDTYQTTVQTLFISSIFAGKSADVPKPSQPQPADMEPATEKTIQINGVSYVLIPDPSAPNDPSKAMAFPVSHTSDAGGAAVPSCTSTEAIWYTLKMAYDSKDQTLFQQAMNGYLYLVEQKEAIVAAGGPTASGASTPGLAGWLPSLGQPPGSQFSSGQFPYPNAPYNPALSTATDADLQILNLMIEGQKTFGNLNLHAFGPFPAGYTPKDTDMNSLKNTAENTFLRNNISGTVQSPDDQAHRGFKYDGVTYNPVLCNDNWGGGNWGGATPNGTMLNPSYFDPVALTNIYNDVASSKDPSISGQAANFKLAVQNSVKYLKALQADYKDPNAQHANSYGMPDNPAWNEGDGPQKNGPHMVGWDSIRFLANVGNFVDFCNHGGQDVFGILPDVKDMGTKMLNYVQSNMVDGTLPYPDGSKLFGGALYGPLLVAMKALTPQDPSIANIASSLDDALKVDMNRMNPTDPNAYLYWQDQYYGIMVGLTCKADADRIR